MASTAATDDREARQVLDELYELAAIGDLSGDQRLAEIEKQWRSNVELLPHLIDEMGALSVPLREETTARTLKGQILLSLLDEETQRSFATRATADHPVLESDSVAGLG